ncbi:MAG: S41 family peptidase [Bacteroidota bacterium]|nr:S41 family peptidase [Bacteroidota bacterium]
MIKIKLIFLSIIVIGHFNYIMSQNDIGNKYLTDFTMLVTNLKELHPILYKNLSQNEFDNEVKKISERLRQTTSQNKAIYMIQELIYKIGNGHAGDISIYNGNLGISRALPFSVYIIDTDLYINDYPADTTLNGTKIISIENTASKSIIDSLKIFFPTDGNRNLICYFLQPYFNTYYSAFCSQKDTFLINTEKGIIKAAACKTESELFTKLIIKKNWEEYFGKSNFKIDVTQNYGYYRFGRFDNPKNEKAYYSLIKELNEKKVNNLIIDLRYNNGGEALMTGKMASYLKTKPFKIFTNMYITNIRRPTNLKYMGNKLHFKFRNLKTVKKNDLRKIVRFEKCLKEIKPNKNAFKGHIYILTGSITLSASTMFCKYLEDETNVSFVGSETSGAINYLWASNFCITECKNLNTIFSFGMELLELKENSIQFESPKGLIPENKIEYTIQDRLNKKDKELDWVKEDIFKNNK